MTTKSRAGITGTVTVHALLIGAVLWFGRSVTEPVQNVFAVTLIAAPAAEVTTPNKVTKAPEPVKTRDVVPILKPTKQPVKPEPKKPEPTKDVTKPVTPTVTPLASQKPSVGTDIENVKVAGFEGKYTEYIKNIYNQIYTQWEKTAPHMPYTAEILFTILPDGSVTAVSVARSGGVLLSDSQAKAAIGLVGAAKGFTPLPDGLLEMKISFTFKPEKP